MEEERAQLQRIKFRFLTSGRSLTLGTVSSGSADPNESLTESLSITTPLLQRFLITQKSSMGHTLLLGYEVGVCVCASPEANLH